MVERHVIVSSLYSIILSEETTLTRFTDQCMQHIRLQTLVVDCSTYSQHSNYVKQKIYTREFPGVYNLYHFLIVVNALLYTPAYLELYSLPRASIVLSMFCLL